MITSFIRLSLTILILLPFFVLPIYSQDNTNTHQLGFTASLQDNQIDFLIPIWLNSKTTIAPAIGLIWIQDAGTDLHIGIVPKFYFNRNKLSPYLSFRVCLLKEIPSSGDGTTDWLVGMSLGGEYFIDDNFSVGIDSQLNYTKSDDKSSRFGNPGKSNINTAALVFASVYF